MIKNKTKMKAPKEFEELPSGNSYIIEMQNKSNQSLGQTIDMAKKDAWNAAIRWSTENAKIQLDAEYVWDIDEQSILNGLIED